MKTKASKSTWSKFLWTHRGCSSVKGAAQVCIGSSACMLSCPVRGFYGMSKGVNEWVFDSSTFFFWIFFPSLCSSNFNVSCLWFILFHYYPLEAYLFANEKNNGSGSGRKRRCRGNGKSRGRRNHNQDMVCKGKKSIFNRKKWYIFFKNEVLLCKDYLALYLFVYFLGHHCQLPLLCFQLMRFLLYLIVTRKLRYILQLKAISYLTSLSLELS